MHSADSTSRAPDCIVTGGSGFIGTHLLASLLETRRWERIHVLDLNPPGLKDPRIQFHQCDLREPPQLELDCRGGTCYHLAAICKEPGFPWNDYFVTNHLGTKHTCQLADRSGIENLIFTSTEMVFRAGETENSEDSLKAPDTAYGISKLLGEQEVMRWQTARTGRRVRIARPGVVFGRGENGNFTRLYYALRKHLFFYIGRKSTIKSCIYVKDMVRFLMALTDDRGERSIYNLGYRKPTSIGLICHTMCESFGIREFIPTLPYSLALSASYVFELLNNLGLLKQGIHHRRIQKLYYSTHLNCDALSEIDFAPAYDLAEALADWQADCGHRDLY